MTFFYDLNKKLADLAKKQDLNESAQPAVVEAGTSDYSAKKASAGKDIGKPGKMFSKIAKSAGKEYGSKAAGERVAGAVLNKLRAKESVDEATLGGVGAYAALQHAKNLANNRTADNDTEEKKPDWRPKSSGPDHDEESMDETQMDEGIIDSIKLAWYKILFKLGDKAMAISKDPNNATKMKQAKDQVISDAERLLSSKIAGHPREEVLRKQVHYIITQLQQQNTMSDFNNTLIKLAKQLKPEIDKMDEADMEEGNKFTGNLMKARAAGLKKADLDGDGDMEAVREAAKPDYIDLDKDGNRKETMKKAAADKKKSRSTGTAFDPEVAKTMVATDKHPRYDVKDTGYSKRYTRKVQDEPADDAEVSTEPKKKGRPKGPAKGPERVTKGSYKYKAGRPAKVDEDDVNTTDRGEYDREGDMAKEQMHTIMSAAKELHSMLRDEENLPEWVQKKITLAMNYIDTARDYMLTQHAERAEEEPIAEKAVSKKQQRFMGMVHAAQKGEKASSPEVGKVAKSMGKKDAEDFAKTKHKGLPEKAKAKKKDESVEETAEAPKEKKSSGGYNFGGGVYESLDRKFQQALTEGMNVSVNMSTGQDGQPTKSINISADGEDADKLADLLKMAGLSGQEQACSTCGSTPCGCESLDENSPDWPTNTETSDNAMQYSGGLNGPKSTGQTTTPVLASQLRRQVSMEEGVKIEQSLFKLYNQYKLK
jgi:hypothetical protein